MSEEDDYGTCRKCGGKTEYNVDEKTWAREEECLDCGHVETHGFGVL